MTVFFCSAMRFVSTFRQFKIPVAHIQGLNPWMRPANWLPVTNRKFHFGVDNWNEDTLKNIEAEWKGPKLRDALPKIR